MTTQTSASDGVWVGLDLGTQSVRALAVTSSGDVVGAGTRKLASHRDGPRHEQDPELWWQAVAAASTEALGGLTPGAVNGVAVDATSGTVLLMDHQGRPLTAALMYDDTRAAGEVDRVNEAGDAVWTELGYRRMQPAWALPKLLWMLREYPELAADARLAHQNDFINRRLVGDDVPTDLSNALKTGAHLIDEVWPEHVFQQLGVPEHLLPRLVRPGTTIGSVCRQAAEATQIPQGTPVVSGVTDGCAAQLGAGALSVGSWNSVLGTTLVLKGVTRDLIRDPLGVVYSHKAPNGDWLPGGASSTGAGVISRDYGDRDLANLDRRASTYEPASVLAYPLVSVGERFPFVAPQAEGFVLGTPAGEADRYAAILQGVGYIERLCFDYLHLLGAPVDGDLILTGGATKSAYWCQLRADILGRPVSLPENAEPALGMAVLAASPGRQAADVAAEMVRVRDVIEPRTGSAGRYDAAYARFVEELEQRGWLQPAAAAHARERTAR
ncbi:MAG: carbohydrate kinase [Propionibacteriales bacterium]|nr:carbohydrate kinase [Propionibacteriales bacterium]